MVVLSQEEAREYSSHYIGTEHLLLAHLRIGRGLAFDVLTDEGMTYDDMVDTMLKMDHFGEYPSPEAIPFTPRVKKVLENSLREALAAGNDFISAEHMLIALASEKEDSVAFAFEYLEVSQDNVVQRLRAPMKNIAQAAPSAQQPGPRAPQPVHETPAPASSPFSPGKPKRSWFGRRKGKDQSTKRGLEGPQG